MYCSYFKEYGRTAWLKCDVAISLNSCYENCSYAENTVLPACRICGKKPKLEEEDNPYEVCSCEYA